MSDTEAMSCKLPLLDGEATSEPWLMMTELELDSSESLQNFGKGDVVSFNDLLCTAWALLLRCYTGQDNVSFYLRQGNIDHLVSKSAVPRDHQPTFRMAFHDQESLSACVARAKDGYVCNQRGGQSLVSKDPDSRPFSAARYQNTHVWVQDATCIDTQDFAVQKVF